MGSEAVENVTQPPVAGRPAEAHVAAVGELDGMSLAQAERRHGPLAEVGEVVVAETLAQVGTLASADRLAWAAAARAGRAHAVVAWKGAYFVVRLCEPFEPDTLRLPSDGPQLMSWCLPDGVHPIMRARGVRTLFRTEVTIQQDR